MLWLSRANVCRRIFHQQERKHQAMERVKDLLVPFNKTSIAMYGK
jgi:hypothetical protein